MNERIRELAVQADGVFIHKLMTGAKQYTFLEKDLAKFAELIVKECEKVISDGRYSDMACEGNSHRISYNNGRFGASKDIKEHFGVEE